MKPQPIRAALFDADGIAIVGRKRFFSERLAEDLGIPNETVQEFFSKELKRCTFGNADLKDLIAPYLVKWGWPGTVDSLLEYWFVSESTKDDAVLAIVKELRDKGIKCYLATRQEKYRMQYLLDEVGLRDHFDGTFVTHEIGFDKSEPAFFEHALKTLNLSAEKVLFFDDTQKNVDTARAMGIDAHFYDGIDVLLRETDPILN